jgi:hypothetical protein
MLGGLVQAGTKALGGERFSLVSLLPTTLLVGYVSFLWASGLYARRTVNLGGVVTMIGKNAGWAVFAVFGIFVVSVLLRPLQISLVWMLEGYWDRTPVLKWIEPLALERHLRRRRAAEVTADQEIEPGISTLLQSVIQDRRRVRRQQIRRRRAELRMDRYPEVREHEADADEIRMMPTMLGNALRKGEDDAGDRYGLDFPTIAPRLYPHLSGTISTEIGRNFDAMESGASLTIVFLLAAASSVPLLWRGDAWFLAVPIALLLALLAYLGTLRTAREHGLLLASAVDLHRFDMLAKLRYQLPETVDDEWELNQQLSAFLETGREKARDFMRDYRYAHPVDQPVAASEPASAADEAAEPAAPAD